MGRKALKRRLGKKVINGSMTQDDAWNRLERPELEKRDRQARQAVKSAGSTPPSPAAVYEAGRGDEYMQSAFAPMTLPLKPTTIQKARQNAADRQYEQATRHVREFIAKASEPAAVFSPITPAVPAARQLTQSQHAALAELRREEVRVAHIPARREEVRAQILRITGDPFTSGAL